MIALSKGLVRLGFVFAAFLLITPSLSAQNCRVFEREMETLFMNHEAQSSVPRQELERIRARCPQPSSKMLLIYNFFRAVDAYQSTSLTDREAYDRAVGYYNRAAENFLLLTDYELEDPFFETFYDRAAEFETAIQDLAYQAGLNTRTRQVATQPATIQDRYSPSGRMASRGSVNTRTTNSSIGFSSSDREVNWSRENVLLPSRVDIEATQQNARTASNRNSEWDLSTNNSSFRGTTASGQRTRSNARTAQTARNIDSYAGVQLVGDLSSLDPVGYLRYSRSAQNATNVENLRVGTTRSAASTNPNPSDLWTYNYVDQQSSGANARTSTPNGVTRTANVQVRDAILVNVATSISLTNRPGKSSPEINKLGYGEAVYRVANVSPSFQQGEQYVQVQTVNGELGWLPQSVLVEDGRLAVVIQSVRGNSAAGAEAVTFYPGEPVVLAKYENNQALIIGENAQKVAWVSDLAALSISEEDMQIADMIKEAMSFTSIYARRSKLLDIQRHPYYAQSPLSSLVDRLVAQEAGR